MTGTARSVEPGAPIGGPGRWGGFEDAIAAVEIARDESGTARTEGEGEDQMELNGEIVAVANRHDIVA